MGKGRRKRFFIYRRLCFTEFRHAAAKWCPHFLLLTYDDSSFPCHLSQCRLISRHLKRRQFQLRDASRASEVYLPQLSTRAVSSFAFFSFYDRIASFFFSLFFFPSWWLQWFFFFIHLNFNLNNTSKTFIISSIKCTE